MKESVAYHEAGHIAAMLDFSVPIDHATIIPAATTWGHTQESVPYTISRQQQLIFLYAGDFAETLREGMRSCSQMEVDGDAILIKAVLDEHVASKDPGIRDDLELSISQAAKRFVQEYAPQSIHAITEKLLAKLTLSGEELSNIYSRFEDVNSRLAYIRR